MRVLDDSRLPDSEVWLSLEPTSKDTGITDDFALCWTYSVPFRAERDDVAMASMA